MSKILVIKHGALGDVVLATAPFQAIRAHHKDDHITLLTTKPYVDLLHRTHYFDDIKVDSRPKLTHPLAFFRQINDIRNGGYSRVYDLQTSERTSWYYTLMRRPRPEWVGTATGASHLHNTPERRDLHTVERHKQQLAVAGIYDLPCPDLSWLTSDISRFNLPKRYAVIIPGGSSHRPGKRWPASHYGTLCAWLVTQGITPVLIGTETENMVLSTVESICREAVNLRGETSLADLAELARGALFTIGNDTGPMHLVAVAGSPCLVLFSNSSNPVLCAPFGERVNVMRREPLSDLTPDEVITWVKKTLKA